MDSQKIKDYIKVFIPSFLLIALSLFIMWKVIWTLIQYDASMSIRKNSTCQKIIDSVMSDVGEGDDDDGNQDYWARTFKINNGNRYDAYKLHYDRINKDFKVDCACQKSKDPSGNYVNRFRVNLYNKDRNEMETRTHTCSCENNIEDMDTPFEVATNDATFGAYTLSNNLKRNEYRRLFA